MAIQKGSRGPKVRQIQLELKALGYYEGDVDGVFGPLTHKAVTEFQDAYESLTVSGVVDAETAAALAQALAVKERPTQPPPPPSGPPAPCVPEVWGAFENLVAVVTSTPVMYGPGRGLFADGQWVITQGPGKLGSKKWKSKLGHTYPSFHCSSWTNFFLGWLLRYNERYTHAGNVPTLFDLCEQSDELHAQSGGAKYRGYGPHCQAIESDGQTKPRMHVGRVLDIQEIHDRRATLPTFLVCAQSTKQPTGWKWWHHTLLFVVDHSKPDHPLFRLAADGFKASDGTYSASQMKWTPIDASWMAAHAGQHVYRGYGVVSANGGYGQGRPLCNVQVES